MLEIYIPSCPRCKSRRIERQERGYRPPHEPFVATHAICLDCHKDMKISELVEFKLEVENNTPVCENCGDVNLRNQNLFCGGVRLYGCASCQRSVRAVWAEDFVKNIK